MKFKRPLLTGPQFINWNYTYRCNFQCHHCYSRADSYPDELSTEQYLGIVDQLVEAQVFQVALGGGEVLLRGDCTTILSRLSSAGVQTMLTTNGWFVDDVWAKRLRDAGLGELNVSLDSPDAAVHDAFRDRQGSYDRVLRCLEATRDVGYDVLLSVVLTRINVHDLERLVEIAARYGVRGVHFKRFRPSGNGLRNRERYELSDAEGAEIGATVARLRQAGGPRVNLSFGPEAGPTDAGCGCGISALALRPNGDVAPCVYGDVVLGNLMSSRLIELWRSSPELAAMRAAGGCIGRNAAVAPSNPRSEPKLVALQLAVTP